MYVVKIVSTDNLKRKKLLKFYNMGLNKKLVYNFFFTKLHVGLHVSVSDCNFVSTSFLIFFKK